MPETTPAPRQRSAPCARPICTRRQMECLRWIAEGKTDWEVGQILKISAKTVNYHVEQAKERLDVPTRIQAVVALIRNGDI